jgi:ABC-type multidrug transport system fused ATPase/permease subunit
MIRNKLSSLRDTTIYKALSLMSSSDRKKLSLVVILQFMVSLLDLLGVALVGVLGAVVVAGLGSGVQGNRVTSIIEFFGMQNQSLQFQSAVLGSLVAVLLVLRTLATVIIARRTLFFLSRKAAQLSASLLSRLLSQSYAQIKSESTHSTIFSLTYGVQVVILGVLGVAINTIADFLILLILGVGLAVVDPLMAILTFTLFGVVGLMVYLVTNTRATKLGFDNSKLMVKSDEKTSEVLNSYREIVVRNRQEFYAREIGKIRMDLSNTVAEIQFLPQISKYIIEITMVLGGLLICAIQFQIEGATRAIATLGVFLVASTRIAPAVMRIQQGATGIKLNLGVANPTLDLIDSLHSVRPVELSADDFDLEHKGFEPTVRISDVSFMYPNSQRYSLENISTEVKSGSRVAVVGASGAGKTTLIDILLGMLIPTNGFATISGLAPLDCMKKWPGSIGYVPQDVVLSQGTIRDNVSLGYPTTMISDELIWKSLEKAQIAEFVRSLPKGLDSSVGERGSRLSGGQRQRLGIARALVTNPRLLILDEATSSLDVKTEHDFTNTILAFDKNITVIVIAHRLSTVRNSEEILFLKEGQLLASGSFEQLRESVPDFEHQAKISGL